MAKKEKSLTAFDVLAAEQAPAAAGVCAIVGDDGFLAHETCKALATAAAGGGEWGADVRDGRTSEYRDIHDLLCERSLFATGGNVVVIEDADPFVKAYREQLEVLVDKLPDDALLILQVSSWPGNTRLAKAVAAKGLTVACSRPEKGAAMGAFDRQLKDWLVVVAQRECNADLARAAADALLEQLPPDAGLLYQEVNRLSLLAEKNGDGTAHIDAALVREHVGGWRARKTWDMIDAAAEGRAADALAQLDRLLAAGEEPHAILPQMSSTLRKFGLAVDVFKDAERRGQRTSLRFALESAGVMAFKLNDAEQQLRQVGRDRAAGLLDRLLAADLSLKGHNSGKEAARRVIETIIVELSQEAAPAR
ncbi:MAG: hypothetical protein CMJ58_01680 [Planctomycetaceae bacterium]|nr:hypothetical protein [Planctomycetaceae bacterium]